MTPDEYAVHYSSFRDKSRAGYCTILNGLAEAEAYAEKAVRDDPTLRCRIYGAEGFVGAPVREKRGTLYKGEGEITAKFRRWCGGGLLGGGLLLIAVDWGSGFTLSWPALLGSRLVIPGVVLLATEALVLLHAKQKVTQAASGQAGNRQA